MQGLGAKLVNLRYTDSPGQTFNARMAPSGAVQLTMEGRAQKVAVLLGGEELLDNGWLHELLEGIIELYSHPVTLHSNTYLLRRGDPVLKIEYVPHLHRDGVETIMGADLRPAEKAAMVTSLTLSGIPLHGEELKKLIASVPRLNARHRGSLAWASAYRAYLLPIASTATGSQPLDDPPSVNLRRGDWFMHYAASWGHCENAGEAQTFGEYRLSNPSLPGSTSLTQEAALRVERNIVNTLNNRALDALTPAQFLRLLVGILTPDNVRWTYWFCRRILSGKVVAAEEGESSAYRMEQAKYFLTSQELKHLIEVLEREGYPTTHAVFIDLYARHHEALLQTYYVLFAEIGPDGAEEVLSLMGGMRTGRDLSAHLSSYMASRARYRKILRLFEEPYASMPLAFALDLISLSGNRRSQR